MDTQTFINGLTGAFLIVGTGLVGLVVWFAGRLVSQVDRILRIIGRILRRLAILESKVGISITESDSEDADSL